ncbi:hypothetical protein C8J56DRAFT_67021 [Mycena floridula]|nr:hypothetical protein C8J56DRAFT_67021 [Mycena floridula]
MLVDAVPVDNANTTGERPIWPVVLWIVFAEFVENISISSLVEFISIQQNDLCSWDDEREQWLRDHIVGSRSVNDWFDFYTSQLEDEHWQLLNAIVTSTASESRRHERCSSIRSEIQVKLCAFIWITAIHGEGALSDSAAGKIASITTKLHGLFGGFPALVGFPCNHFLPLPVNQEYHNHARSVLSSSPKELPPELAFRYPQAWLCGRKAILDDLRSSTSYSPDHSSVIPLGLPYWTEYASMVSARGSESTPLIEDSMSAIGTLVQYSSLYSKMLRRIKTLPTGIRNVEEISDMIRIDTFTLVAQIQVLLKTAETYRTLVSQKGDDAVRLLDLLHQLIDWRELPRRTRAQFTGALVLLSKKSGCHPELLGLPGLAVFGSQAVHGGAFGDIWPGLLQGKEVSIKVARSFRDDQIMQQSILKAFYGEAILWSQLSHPNILPLYGIYDFSRGGTSQLCLVSPWMDNGNISRFLRYASADSFNRHSLIIDIARGLEYLHQESIIHGDLKGANILITSSLRACLMDFGVSSIADSHIPTSTSR